MLHTFIVKTRVRDEASAMLMDVMALLDFPQHTMSWVIVHELKDLSQLKGNLGKLAKARLAKMLQASTTPDENKPAPAGPCWWRAVLDIKKGYTGIILNKMSDASRVETAVRLGYEGEEYVLTVDNPTPALVHTLLSCLSFLTPEAPEDEIISIEDSDDDFDDEARS